MTALNFTSYFCRSARGMEEVRENFECSIDNSENTAKKKKKEEGLGGQYIFFII